LANRGPKNGARYRHRARTIARDVVRRREGQAEICQLRENCGEEDNECQIASVLRTKASGHKDAADHEDELAQARRKERACNRPPRRR
jgi:hypothetical protein